MFKKIVWATDGSENSDAALSYVKEIASEGGSVIVAHCTETFRGYRVAGLPLAPDEDELKAKVERQVSELTDAGIEAALEMTAAPAPGAAHVIARVAEEAGADVIVVGTRGQTPLGGLLLGSVTQRLLHIAPCPVLAVPMAIVGSAGGDAVV